MEPIYWTTLMNDAWPLIIAATDKGLCFVGSVQGTITELKQWQQKKMPKATLVENSLKLKLYEEELLLYINGEKESFQATLDLIGTPFQLQVWQALQQIPYGQTCAYIDIANRINNPRAVRAVGLAIGANPVAVIVPCHRVIGKNGRLVGYRGGLDMKKKLLQIEQIPFSK